MLQTDELLLRLLERAERGELWVPVREIRLSTRNLKYARWHASKVALLYGCAREKWISPRIRLLQITPRGIERLVYKKLVSPERAKEVMEKIKIATTLLGEEKQKEEKETTSS